MNQFENKKWGLKTATETQDFTRQNVLDQNQTVKTNLGVLEACQEAWEGKDGDHAEKE